MWTARTVFVREGGSHSLANSITASGSELAKHRGKIANVRGES
jgi:hypothetical protein